MVSVSVMSDDVQPTSDVRPKDKARNSPKHSQDTWLKVRMEYESGTWTSVKELSEKYGIHYQTLYTRLKLEKWDIKRQEILEKAQIKVENKALKAVDVGSEYLLNTFSRAKKYEVLIDRSIEQTGGLVEPSDLDAYTRSEQRIHALALSALRLPATVQPVDIRSNGLSIGESIITAIEKLRANPSAIVHVSSEQVDRVLEMEVVDDPPKA